MSKMVVQCKGSGQAGRGSSNPKRATCPFCHKTIDLASTGKLRKHTRIAKKSDLKRMSK